MDVSKNGGTQQYPWVFLLKLIISGCEMGVPLFLETPISRKMDFCRCLAGYYCCCFEIKVALSIDLSGFHAFHRHHVQVLWG